MPRYTVIGLMSADVSVEVEAANAEEAAMTDKLPHPALCHQCAREIALGDIYETEVWRDGKKVWGGDSALDESEVFPEDGESAEAGA